MPLIRIFRTALLPSASVLVDEPGCENPSMRTMSVMAGSAFVGKKVCGPAPGTLKTMRSPALKAELASRMAWRSEPAPESFVLITV